MTQRQGVVYKSFIAAPRDVSVKAGGSEGTGRFVVARLGVVDSDGDLAVDGYFGRQHVPMVPSHDWTHVPIGRGVLYERANEALVDFTMNLKVAAGRDWFEAIKFDLEHPPSLQEYSYGCFIRKGGSRAERMGDRTVRILQPLPDGSPGADVVEVSPVLRGAGVGTRTVSLAGSQTGKAIDVGSPGFEVIKAGIGSGVVTDLEGYDLTEAAEAELTRCIVERVAHQFYSRTP